MCSEKSHLTRKMVGPLCATHSHGTVSKRDQTFDRSRIQKRVQNPNRNPDPKSRGWCHFRKSGSRCTPMPPRCRDQHFFSNRKAGSNMWNLVQPPTPRPTANLPFSAEAPQRSVIHSIMRLPRHRSIGRSAKPFLLRYPSDRHSRSTSTLELTICPHVTTSPPFLVLAVDPRLPSP